MALNNFRLIANVIVILIYLSTGFSVFADSTAGFRLKHLSTEDGLPNTSVSSILQDDNDFLWFGTQGGLARYDGYEFRVFNQDPFDDNSLSHNVIQTMLLDSNGSIWIGTYNGLNHFDPISERFTRYQHDENNDRTLSDNVVVSIFRDSSGRLWVGTLNGLNLMNEDGTFRRFLPDSGADGSLPNKVVRTIAEDSRGKIWIGTYGGISGWDEKTGEFQTFSSREDQGGLPGDAVMTIIPAADKNCLWLGLWTGGIVKLNTITGETEHLDTPGYNIYRIYFDSSGQLWAGTWGQGLLIIDTDSGSMINHSTSTSEELSHDVIYSLHEDRSGVMWIGTNGGGLLKYVNWHNRFKYFSNLKTDEDSLSKGKIYSMLEDDKGRIWAGVYGSGINRIDRESGKITRYFYDSEDDSSLSNEIVNEMIQDSQGNIWIGTYSGLCLYLPETDNFKRFYNPSAIDKASENIFTRIFEDSDGRIWLGTFNSGLLVYTPETDGFIYYHNTPGDSESLSNNLIRKIFQDSRGRIWIGTNSGLNLFLPETGTFRRFMHEREGTISGNDIRSIFESQDGTIWIGTMGGGISIYNPETDKFSYLSRKDGLLSNMIVDIKSAGRGEIWIAEQNGLSIYMEDQKTFRQITGSSGLLDGELTAPLLFTTDGYAYCGGTGGITAVPLSLSEDNTYKPLIRITKLIINGEDFSADNTPIKSGSIVLRHNQNNINIELNSTDYSFPLQNRFIYKLDGFSPEWTSAGNRHYISYTNLPSGNYTFSAQGSGSRNNWSRNTLQLKIRIEPRPLLSAYAIGIYLLAGICIPIFVFYGINRKKLSLIAAAEEAERKNRELEQRVLERTAEIEEARHLAEEALGAKSLFLANMSHEIRTPLNGILGMLSLLKKTASGAEQKQYIDYSQISAENLLLLLDDILDYEKLKSGKVNIQEEAFALREIIEYTKSLFSTRAEEKNITIEILYEAGLPSNFIGDKRKLTQILSNLLSNAVKYTDSGRIMLKIGGNTDGSIFNCMISISDSGRGIPEEKIQTIFNSFEQLDSSYTKTEKGVGLGLAIVEELISLMGGTIAVKSVSGKGTEFLVTIPLRPAAERANIKTSPKPAGLKHGSKARIMIAEDEAINRLYITKLLKTLGYDFISCTNGLEAFERYSEYKPDIILMDIGMPVMNGMEAIVNIRETEKSLNRHALIIMLSAHVYKDDIERARLSGADDFLGKPFSEQEFTESLMLWVNKID